MQRFCIDLHAGTLNMAFADLAVRPVGPKELRVLKWHRNFSTSGPWTRVGDVAPEDWPDWMGRHKDY